MVSRINGNTIERRSSYLLQFAFFLVPLSYSFDNDPYRAWEVMIWAGLALTIAIGYSIRFRWAAEVNIALVYGVVLVLQQLFIERGSLWFGVQYALVFAAAIVPSLLLRSLKWSPIAFARGWDAAIKGLSIIIVFNVLGGYLFGWGESYVGGLNVGRYFGYLGDSISPVIVFPICYFFFERRYVWVILLLGCMVLTGGKAAALLLLACPVLLIVIRMRLRVQLLAGIVLLASGTIWDYATNVLFQQILTDPLFTYSYNTRMLSYGVGISYFQHSPIWGIGINQSIVSMGWDSEVLAVQENTKEYWPVYQIHNAFIRALAETGLVGFSVLVGFCGLLIARALRAMQVANNSAPSPYRSVVLSAGLWSVLFIVTYQSTGWFEHGHPQFAWLLTLGTLTTVGARLLVRGRS